MEYKRVIDHATSVKKIQIIEEPTATRPGLADFTFNPVFSVFDFGTIKPPVELDNRTICLMAGFNFELLKDDEALPTHYRGLVDKDGNLISAHEAIRKGIAPDTIRVIFVNREMPVFKDGKWDYSKFRNPPNNYVQPIEFISRNELPPEASVWKGKEEDVAKALRAFGLPPGFEKGDPIPEELKPLLSYSTKFEKGEGDRTLTAEEAQALMGIDNGRFATINGITRAASQGMTSYAASRGFTRLDGKVEYVVLPTELGPHDVLGDAVCTWHEDRLTYGGIGISKQRIRDRIKKLNPEWYAEIERAKALAKEKGLKSFRDEMNLDIKYNSPSPEFFHAINALFRAATNQWVDARVFDVHPGRDDSLEDSLDRAVEEFQRVK